MEKRCLVSIIILAFLVFNINSVSAICTGTASQTQVTPESTITIEWSCSAGNEKNQAYTVAWYNLTSAGSEIIFGANDTGTTPNTANEIFIETYVVPLGFNVSNNITGNLSNGVLDGGVEIEIVAAGSNNLLLTDIKTTGTFLGLSSSIDIDVTDSNDKKITGGTCNVRVQDPTIDENFVILQHPMSDGDFDASWILDYTQFKENKDYEVQLTCFCGSNNSIYECVNEDGTRIENAVGTTFAPFTTSEWIIFREDPFPTSLANGTRQPSQNLSAGFDRINWIRNITNNNPDDEPLETIVRTFLVNNETGRIYGLLNEGSESVRDRGVAKGNSTSTFDHLISRTAPSGIYHITLVFDVIYKAQFQVAQYIRLTEAFNVTSVQDTITLNEVVVEDFFSNEVNTSASTQSLTSLPSSNFSDPFTLLTEGFHSGFCLNITNNRDEEIEIFLDSLILENPITSVSKILVTSDNIEEADIPASSTEELCFDNILPTELNTHSDYRFSYEFHIGNTEEIFKCEQCTFSGQTDYFYVASIENMIDIPKFITSPTSTDKGRPGIFIMNKKNEKLYMFDDYNYTDQSTTDWGNSSVNCEDKDDGSSKLCDLSVYPNAGEPIKACFEAKSYFRNELFISITDVILDRDIDESVVVLSSEEKGEVLKHSVKSTTDSDMYLSEASSRGSEGDKNLTDGRNFFCTDWMTLPSDIYGSNDWDIQMKFRINSKTYNLPNEVSWIIESDEFPIFGLFEQQPKWGLHLFSPIHYNAPEKWNKVTDNQYTFSLNLSVLGNGKSTFNFGEHLPFRLLDEETSFERLINTTVTYANGSDIPHDTELFVQFEQIVLLIKDVNLSEGDNNFTITVNTYDFTNRSVVALEDAAEFLGGINSSAGTFDFSISVPDTATPNVLVTGFGVTMNGQVLDRDVQITCQVEGFNESKKTFMVGVTNNFTFIEEIKVPVTSGIYTMVCSGEDSKFGRFITAPVSANFKVLPKGFFERVLGKISVLKKFNFFYLIFLMLLMLIVVCLLFMYKGNKRRKAIRYVKDFSSPF